jgi:hypothetical protein
LAQLILVLGELFGPAQEIGGFRQQFPDIGKAFGKGTGDSCGFWTKHVVTA